MSLNYYFLFFLLIISSIKEFNLNEKGNKTWYYIIVVYMILNAGLAFAISPDWIPYYYTFQETELYGWDKLFILSESASMERGYLAINKLLFSLGFDFGMLTLVIASLSLILKSTTFYKYGGLPFLVLYLFSMPNYMFEEHIHIRQGLSTAIAVFSIRYIINKQLFKFFLCIMIGYQFHESIIVFILAYWVANLKINDLLLGWIVTIAIVGNYVGINSFIEVLMQYMPFGQDKFEDYQSQLYTESGVSIGDIVKIISVLVILIFNKYAIHDKLYPMFRNLFFMGVVLYFFLGKGIFGIRLPGFYLIFLGLTVGRMLYSFSGSNGKRVIVYTGFMIYTTFLIFWFQYKQSHKSNFENYRTFFNSGSNYGIWR